MTFARALGLVCVVALLPLTSRAAPPAQVRVAVFSDPAYVDEASAPPGAEGPNTRAALASLGFAVTPFTGITAAEWRTAMDAADVVDLPDNEVASLPAVLPAATAAVLRDFVAAGGVLVIHGDFTARAPQTLNLVFGFATASAFIPFGETSNALDLGNGTRFLKRADSLSYNNGEYGITGLPVGSRTLYQTTPSAVASAVYIPFGAGKIVYLAWDWYDGAPTGSADGGWNDILRRAVLEGRPPTRRIAIFDDAGYVDTGNTAFNESDTLQSTLLAQDDLVTGFGGILASDFSTALGAPRQPSVDVLVIPEAEPGDLGAALAAPTQDVIRNFVAAGGTLVIHGSYNFGVSTLLNNTFGFAITEAGIASVDSTKTSQVGGTLFVKTPDTLTNNSACMAIGGLPPGAKSLYEAGAGATTLALIPYREGRILYVGWDWFDALPLGVEDGGWLAAYDAAIRSAPPARRVAVWNDPAFVNADTGTSSEQVNVRASLVSRGHAVSPFKGATDADWSAALARAEVVVVPDLETADAAPALDAATRAHIAAFVKRGGVFVTSVGQSTRGLTLANAIFGTAFSGIGGAGPYPQLGAEIVGTPFSTGPLSLTQNNATTLIQNSPANARRVYTLGTDAAVVWAPFGAGHVLVLGWDWFNAAPGGGAADGGWVDVLDLAVQSTHSRTRRVAVFDDDLYVDSSSAGVAAESDNVQATLAQFDHPVAPFQAIDETAFRSALASADVLLIPEQEHGLLGPALPADSKEVIRDFVASGGTLVVQAFGAPDLLARLVGPGVIEAGPGGGPYPLDALAPLGTRFAGGPAAVPQNNATSALGGTLPFATQPIYTGPNTPVAWIPYGLGRIVYLGYDWFDAAPIGGQDGGWVDVLDRAVQEARPRSRTVAIFDDPAFVDTANSTSAESDVLQAAVVAAGHVSVPFVGVTADTLSAALAKTQALYIPELGGALLPSLTPAARQVLRDYVARGGSLAISIDGGSNGVSFLNGVYGLNLAVVFAPTTPYSLTAGAAGTTFAGGPAAILAPSATVTVSGLPANATAIYDHGGIEPAVARIPYGAGEITTIGWDFFGRPPYFVGDIGQAGWFDVLGRALDGAEPAARRIALYADPAVVDDAGSFLSEATNLKLLTLQLEHAVVPFTGTDLVLWNTALIPADVLLVPEQEISELTPLLAAPTLNVIRQFVNGGGGLIVHGTVGLSAGRSTTFLNAVFATATTEIFTDGDAPAVLTPPTVGTQFAGGPSSLTEQNATSGINGLPAGSLSLYVSPTTPKTFVAEIPRGYGRAIYLGWDFYDAAPNGSVNDAAWNDVLDRAIRENMGGDSDEDGVVASVDLCPITFDPAQGDTDADGVGNSCDNCTGHANPRVTNGDAVFLAANVWATLTGAQRDDDHDGYGNRCDAKFVGAGLVGGLDLTQFRASNNKSRTLDTCGTPLTTPCAIFDLNEADALIGGPDLTIFRSLNNKLPGPRCTTCALPCSAGPTGTCN